MKLPTITVNGRFPFPENYKRPKKVGELVDLYERIDELRALGAKIEKQAAELLTVVRKDYIQLAAQEGLTGSSGKNKQLSIRERDIFIVDNNANGFAKFMDYVVKNKAYHLLNKSINEKACAEEIEMLSKKKRKKVLTLPGLAIMRKKSVSLTKLK